MSSKVAAAQPSPAWPWSTKSIASTDRVNSGHTGGDSSSSTMVLAEPTLFMRLVLAGCSNCAGAAVTNPAEVVKTRMQLDVTRLNPGFGTSTSPAGHGAASAAAASQAHVLQAHRLGVLETIKSIARNEGVRGFYRGLAPSLLRESTYSATRLGLYEPIRDLLVSVLVGSSSGQHQHHHHTILASPAAAGAPASSHPPSTNAAAFSGSTLSKDSYVIKLLAGAISGCIGQTIANPTDLLKVRLQAATSSSNGGVAAAAAASVSGGAATAPPSTSATATAVSSRPSLVSMLSHIYTHEGGIKGLWRGIGPSLSRAAIITGAQVGTYDQTKRYLLSSNSTSSSSSVASSFFPSSLTKEGLPLHIACSVVASLVSSAATCPVDMLKTRMMAPPNASVAATVVSSSSSSAGTAAGGIASAGVAASANPGAFRILLHTIRYEGGILALWKGFLPTWMRLGPHTIVTFMVFEQLRVLAGVRPM